MIKSVGIIIVNYNSGSLLKACVDSVFSNKETTVKLNLVIIDNNSHDNSLDFEMNIQVQVIKNLKNMGFGFACNQGIAALKDSEYILFLNPDTEIKPKTINKSLIFLEDNPEVSILGVCHIDKYDKIKISCSRKPRPLNILFDIIGFSKILPKVFHSATLMYDFDHNSSKFVDQVIGAFMLLKRDVCDRLNGFDTRFFLYYEDADFALRAKEIGYLSYYNSDIKILHHGRGTTEKISHIGLFYNLRSRIQFVNKHYGKFYAILIEAITLTLEPVSRLVFNSLSNNWSQNIVTLKAFRLLFKNIIK